jgi:hypothetical protein
MAFLRHRIDDRTGTGGGEFREPDMVGFPDDIKIEERIEVAGQIARPFVRLEEMGQFCPAQSEPAKRFEKCRACAHAISFEGPRHGAPQRRTFRADTLPNRPHMRGGKRRQGNQVHIVPRE